MKSLSIFLVFFGISISSVMANDNLSIASCPAIGWDFKIAPYLKLAQELQKSDHVVMVSKLREWAATNKYEDQVVILCRMLFASSSNKEFRRPRIGGAHFLGETDYKHWPLEPITIHKNVPILITYGYSLGGKAEPSLWYVNYCVNECEPSKIRYEIVEPKTVSAIINDWLAHQKWTEPLSKRDREFFTKQAE